MYLSAGSPTRSLRTARTSGGDEVLVVGGGGHTVGRQTPTMPEYEQLASWAEERFAVRKVVARWFAHDYVPVDHLPWAGSASPATPNVSVAGGFAKWGMANATAAAMVVAARIADDRGAPPWAGLFDPHRASLTGGRRAVRVNAEVGTNLLRGWARPGPQPPGGSGGDGERYRQGVIPVGAAVGDDGGREERVIVCTHLGGVCTWNDAERTWDCPLHGSRFATDGTVVSGPATKSLARPIRRPGPAAT